MQWAPVSQICALMVFPSRETERVANSTPIVDFDSRLNSLRVNRESKFDFPTPESPITTTVRKRDARSQQLWVGARTRGPASRCSGVKTFEQVVICEHGGVAVSGWARLGRGTSERHTFLLGRSALPCGHARMRVL